jgi:hypothetical protein
MKEQYLKKYLLQIADNLTSESTLQDVYEQLSLLSDIDKSEEQVKKGEILSQEEAQSRSEKWLK